MPTLTVHLREGFIRTPVILGIDGSERFRSEAVTTRTQIGLAEMIPLEVPAGFINVEITLPSLGRSIRETIDVKTDTHLGIDLDAHGRASVRVQTEPFLYM